MSAEQRVTDDFDASEYTHVVLTKQQWTDKCTAHRETEAKLRAALAEVERLTSLVTDYEEVLADKRRLAREIDVAMHGEKGAAKQASLCDLVSAAKELSTRAVATKAKLEEAEGALNEAEETLRLVERPAFPDPVHHERVKALGSEIGFGALMSTASAGWREVVAEKGWPGGGEYVAGPCLVTVQRTLKIIRAALSTQENPDA